MARKAGVEWKAVGASLADLARVCRTLPANSPRAIAYANSGVMQQAGVVMAARYITPENHAEQRGARLNYTAPPNGTHGLKRVARGGRVIERKLFVKGQFVARSGEMRKTALELARTGPTESVGVILAHGVNPQGKTGGDITAGIDGEGRGYLEITGGWKAAEVGKKGGYPMGVKGWWRALRSAQGRWATLLKKKYPDLIRVKAAR
jgi:hypothetical protein